MIDGSEDMARVFLQPAEAVIVDLPTTVHTILGSCVAVTMWSPRKGVGAAAHCVLPSAGASGVPAREAARYVDKAIEAMLRAFTLRGIGANEIQVKLFGGADGSGMKAAGGGFAVGERNIEAALAELEAYGMAPVECEVGGRCGRVIDFDTESGEVTVRRLPPYLVGGRS